MLVKTEFFLSTVTKYLLIFPCITVGSLPYNRKYLEATVVEILCYITKLELNRIVKASMRAANKQQSKNILPACEVHNGIHLSGQASQSWKDTRKSWRNEDGQFELLPRRR